MGTSGVYKIVSQIDDKIYIGGSKNIESRWKWHVNRLRHGNHSNPHLQHAWNKYGESNFFIESVEECNVELLDLREQYWIDTTKCLDPDIGYNIAPRAGIPPMTEETKRKIGDANRGKVSWIKGKHHTDETKEKIRESNSGDGNHMKGKLGEKHHFFGSHHSEDTKGKMREAKLGKLNNHSSKPVMQLSLDGAIIAKFPSAREAQRQTGADAKNIAACLKGKRKKTYGFRWQYEVISKH
jgi:group I intron endonuclease